MGANVSFPFLDNHRFMMQFTVEDVQKTLKKLGTLSPSQYQQSKNGDTVVRITSPGICVEIDLKTKNVSVIGTHNHVQKHKHLFKQVFV